MPTIENEIAYAIRRTLESPNVCDSNLEPANVVDALDRLGSCTLLIATAITPNGAGGPDEAGGHVGSLTEAVMGVTKGLCLIAAAIESLAEAVRPVDEPELSLPQQKEEIAEREAEYKRYRAECEAAFVPPTVQQVADYCSSQCEMHRNSWVEQFRIYALVNPQAFIDRCEEREWKTAAGLGMVKWTAALRHYASDIYWQAKDKQSDA